MSDKNKIHSIEELLNDYERAITQIESMRKSFEEIEDAILKKRDNYLEFVIGECEEFKGDNTGINV